MSSNLPDLMPPALFDPTRAGTAISWIQLNAPTPYLRRQVFADWCNRTGFHPSQSHYQRVSYPPSGGQPNAAP